jgi:hypothetical protein
MHANNCNIWQLHLNAQIRAYDGWERQYNEINNLKIVMRATCAVSDSVLREVVGTSYIEVCHADEFPVR